MLAVTDSSVDADVLRSLADAFDAGAELVEPSELVLRSYRSADEVEVALAAMLRHRPELFRAVLSEGRVVAITGVTAAGRHIARTWSSAADASALSSEGRGAALRRRSLRILIGAAMAVILKVAGEHLPPRD